VATEREQVFVRDAKELRDWLAANHAHAQGVWIVTEKKDAGGVLRCLVSSTNFCVSARSTRSHAHSMRSAR
jgi:hypothetical protein